MESLDITYVSLALGLLLLLLPIYYLWKYRTGLVRATAIGALRMVVQLFLIGLYLKYLFYYDNPFINLLWVVIMVVVATHTALTRTGLKRRVLLIPLSVGFIAAASLVGFYFLGIVLQLHNVFSAQYFIPIFGLLLGNMLTVNVIALNALYDGLQREQTMYYYLLGNGATRHEALAPFVRTALQKAFSPAIANMAVMGLVSLPGTMIGQLLGGSVPDVAIKYQMMIVVITTAATILSLMITIALAQHQTFDEFDRIKEVMKKK